MSPLGAAQTLKVFAQSQSIEIQEAAHVVLEAISDAENAPEPDFETALAIVEAMAARLSGAAQVFRDARLILGGGSAGKPVVAPSTFGPPAAPVPASPYPCPGCGRAGPEKPGELAGDAECLQCGNHMPLAEGQPGTVRTNKGVMLLDPSRRQQLMKQPAFDAEGNPI